MTDTTKAIYKAVRRGFALHRLAESSKRTHSAMTAMGIRGRVHPDDAAGDERSFQRSARHDCRVIFDRLDEVARGAYEFGGEEGRRAAQRLMNRYDHFARPAMRRWLGR